MTREQEQNLFSLYSQGLLTRHDLEKRLGQEVPFGDALLKLYEYRLPLPRKPSAPNAPGVQLLRRLVRQAPHG